MLSQVMRKLLQTLIQRSLYAACIFAIAVSCGLPSALHSLGHALTQTDCEAVSRAVASLVDAKTPIVSVDEKIGECWIQVLVSSVAHHVSRIPSISSNSFIDELESTSGFANTDIYRGFHPRTWVSPRAPPFAA